MSRDASTFGEDEGVSPAEPVENSVLTEKPSVWDQAAERPEIGHDEPVFAKPDESVRQEIKPESSPKPKLEPVSFIERYSHLLAEDGDAAEQKPARLNESAPAQATRECGPATGRGQFACLRVMRKIRLSNTWRSCCSGYVATRTAARRLGSSRLGCR